MPANDSLMHASADLARAAGAVALRHFRKRIDVETKADGSPVTAADREAERTAREWVARRFPADGVLGEEFGVSRPEARRRWIVDSIDGTKSFVRGVPLWGTLVAVAEGEEVLAGAAYFPAVDELVAAAPGCGAWWNGERCRVSETRELGAAAVLTTDERFVDCDVARREGWRALAGRAGVSRTWGDCYGYLLVATGRAEVMVDGSLSAWDAAAVMSIIVEAGGVFTDWSGRATAFGGSAVATNATMAAEARRLLGVGTTEEG